MIKRVYHHFSKWEEHKAGMWRTITGEEKRALLDKAIEFTGNTELYGEWMLKVTVRWPFSCEHNLTCTDMNRQAWIGHAATCLAINCPEEITREAWHHLTQQQQDEANVKADEAIASWENAYKERMMRGKCRNVQLGFQF